MYISKLHNQNKIEIRSWAKEVLKKQAIGQISVSIIGFLQNFEVFKQAQNILFYWPFANEINILPLLELALKENKNCFLPKALKDEQIAFSQIYSLNLDDLEKGIYQNWESTSLAETDFEKLNLIFVPGLVFDKRGYRLGRGKGFYDKLLSMASNARFIGLTTKATLLETLNCLDEWDIPMHYIVSD